MILPLRYKGIVCISNFELDLNVINFKLFNATLINSYIYLLNGARNLPGIEHFYAEARYIRDTDEKSLEV